MKTYALGYQTKGGLKVLEVPECNPPRVIEIGVESIGNMTQPSRLEMLDLFFNHLEEDDIVLTPGGNTFELNEAILQRTPNAHWIPSQRLKGEQDIPEALIKAWQGSPEAFYVFTPADTAVRRVQRAYRQYLQVEKEIVGLANQNSQILRRLRDDLLLLNTSREAFVASYVQVQSGVATKILRSIGQQPAKKKLLEFLAKAGFDPMIAETMAGSWDKVRKVLSQKFEEELVQQANALYDAYTAEKLEKKDALKAETEVNQTRLEALEAHKQECLDALADLLKNDAFADIMAIKGVGPRLGGALVSHIRNPLMYTNISGLLKYFNLLPLNGRRRTRFEAAQMGGAKFGAETDLWQWSTQMALFANEDLAAIYRNYKLMSWLTYNGLYELSREVFKHWGKKSPDGNAENGLEEEGETSTPSGLTEDAVRDFARRFCVSQQKWPILSSNPEARKVLLKIWGSGSGEALAKLCQMHLADSELTDLVKEIPEIDWTKIKSEEDHLKIKELARKIRPLIKSEQLLADLEVIIGTGSWKALKEVVSRGGENIQMRPKRLELMARRETAKQLVKFVYYAWLKAIGQDITPRLAQDKEYLSMCAFVSVAAPDKFDLSMVAKAYKLRALKVANQKGIAALADVPEQVLSSCGEEHVKAILFE